MRWLVATMFLLSLALPCAAESGAGTTSATAHIGFTVHVPPVFKVLQTTHLAGGHEYRVWVK